MTPLLRKICNNAAFRRVNIGQTVIHLRTFISYLHAIHVKSLTKHTFLALRHRELETIMEAYAEKLIDIFFKILDWALLLGLCVTSFSFLKDVWEKYEAKDTNFKISREKPMKGPTIVLCLISSNKSFELDKDFTLFYVDYGSHFERDKKKLKEGDNIASMGKALVNYETIITPFCKKYFKCSLEWNKDKL